VTTSHPDSLVVVAGARVIRAGMVAKLAAVKDERNAAVLKVIEKEGAIGRLSEQLQSECQTFVPSSPLFCEPTMTSRPCSFFRGSDRAGAISSVPRAGRRRPEPGPGCSMQVGGHQREGHWRHCQAWEGDELGHGRARPVAWVDDTRDVDRRGRAPSWHGVRTRVVDSPSCGALGPRHV
jgi:hypothetical protein